MEKAKPQAVERATNLLITLCATNKPNRENQMKVLKCFRKSKENQLTKSQWKEALMLAKQRVGIRGNSLIQS
ncbi:hypothetical protein NVP1293O_69 [Vibrio phage 1.293.O._10N.261.52.E1]|nr:hypothetical protein NVP1293O_69 [Vibrio phage 1.293.O._10N.261.52.E1]